MSNQVREIINKTVLQMLEDSMSAKNIRRMVQKHEMKVHFVPIRYRIIGGILQGLNIKFGNFIEQLLRNIVEIDAGANALQESGEKIKLFFTHQTDALIDTYITNRQLPNSPDDCMDLFDGCWKRYWQPKMERPTGRGRELQRTLTGCFKPMMA